MTATLTPGRAAPSPHPLLAGRRSTRAFDRSHRLDDETVACLLEAARWAPSWGNSQPWRFLVTRRGEPAFDRLVTTLADGNRIWATSASALVLAAAAGPDGEQGGHAWYDTGQAVTHLVLQAHALGLAARQMGGFDAEAARREFALAPGVVPVVVVAIGRHDPDADLPPRVVERERAPRTRRPVAELLL
ncbi:MAG: nitroreductase family protein [Kineosporiaceae bacterium]